MEFKKANSIFLLILLMVSSTTPFLLYNKSYAIFICEPNPYTGQSSCNCPENQHEKNSRCVPNNQDAQSTSQLGTSDPICEYVNGDTSSCNVGIEQQTDQCDYSIDTGSSCNDALCTYTSCNSSSNPCSAYDGLGMMPLNLPPSCNTKTNQHTPQCTNDFINGFNKCLAPSNSP